MCVFLIRIPAITDCEGCHLNLNINHNATISETAQLKNLDVPCSKFYEPFNWPLVRFSSSVGKLLIVIGAFICFTSRVYYKSI